MPDAHTDFTFSFLANLYGNLLQIQQSQSKDWYSTKNESKSTPKNLKPKCISKKVFPVLLISTGLW